VGAAVEGQVFRAVEHELNDQYGAGRVCRALEVVLRVDDARVRKDARVKGNRFLGLIVKPEAGADRLHGGCSLGQGGLVEVPKSEHAILVDGRLWNGLANIPQLDDSIIVEPEDMNDRRPDATSLGHSITAVRIQATHRRSIA
jgi:hypothetical protein